MAGSTNRVAALALATLVSLVAGCGSDAADTEDAGTTGDSGMTVGDLHTEVTVDVTGAVTLEGTSNAPMATHNGVDYESCEQYGGGESNDDGVKYFVLPQMLIDSIDGKTVFVGAMVKNYKGAGKYDQDSLTDAGSPPGISFGGTLYFTQSNTTSEVTTDGKGGGSWTFTNVRNRHETARPDDTISGTVTWTCGKRPARRAG
jgi:hypothetical protein